MEQYISKSALVVEMENLENTYKKCPTRNSYEEGLKEGRLIGYKDALHKINTLEVKEVDLDLEKYVAEDTIANLEKKRLPVTLHGESKAKFKNEFNTVWQLIHGIHFAHVAKHIIEKICLHFAAWGSYNLKFIGNVEDKESSKFDIQVKEIGLEDSVKETLAQKYIDYTFKRHNIDPESKEGQLIYYAYMHGMNQCLNQLNK